MSFILQVFHAPGASTIDDASRAIDSLGAASREDRLRQIRFLTALNERFPSDLDDEDSPWPEGLAPDHLDYAVYVFTVNLDRLDEDLMAHIAECANAEGLHVLDPQNGLFHRSDRQLVRLDGTVSAARAARRVIPEAPSRPLPPDMTAKTCLERLNAAVSAGLAHAGFAPDPRFGDARRVRGAVEQSIEVNAWPREYEVLLSGSLGLRCRPITGVWLKALGGEGATLVNRLAADGWRTADFRLLLSGLPGTPSREAAALGKLTYATDWSWAMAWAERWVAWVEAEGLQHLANLERPAGIARYLLGEPELRMAARRTDLPAVELLNRIVLAGIYGGAARDRWLGALQQYCVANAALFDRGDVSVASAVFIPMVDRLVAWLDTPQFAREAERVRALD